MGMNFQVFNSLVRYRTGKVVQIPSKKIGFACRFIQLSIIVYIIGYVIIYEKGYQETDKAIFSTTTKIKGTTSVNFGGFNSTLFNGLTIYDPEDYTIPPQDGNSVYVMTNMVITPRQHQGECPENPYDVKSEICKSDNDCAKGEYVPFGHGIRTGRCVQSDIKQSVSVCEIKGWCPTENDYLPMAGYNFSKTIPLLDGTKDSTLLIKNQINFPKFKIGRNNVIRGLDKSYMRRCLYNSKTDPLCPVFKLKNIVKECGDDYTDVAFKGAVYGIIIAWDCNLDNDIEDCEPNYKFRRMDDPNTPISKGYNFRYADYYVENGVRYRTLTKSFGIRFELIVFGKAGKFHMIPLLLNLGAGIGLLGIATFWCDLILLHLVKKRDVYREHICECITEDKGISKMGKTKSDNLSWNMSTCCCEVKEVSDFM